MSLEELDNLDTPPVNTVNTVDDFEAALTSTPAVDTAVIDVQAVEDIDVAVVPDQDDSESEE